ncbi:MAG: chromate transporter [bacterium]
MLQVWQLFISFLKVGMLSFGGAYSLIPVIETEVVKNHHWLSNDEFMRILGIVEFIPGAISIKFATYTGYKTAGIAGAIAANLGNLIFPAFLMIIVYYTLLHFEKNPYVIKIFQAIKYAVIGMIVVIMFQYLFKGTFNNKLIIFLLIGGLLIFFKVHPAIIVAISAFIGVLIL